MTVTTVKEVPQPLRIYLNDHLAGSTGGVNLARRLARSHRGTAAGPPLERVATEIAQDRDELREIMAELDVSISRYKSVLTWVGERLGRLKPNGRLLRRAPLSPVLELELMMLGVEGKAAGWRALRTTQLVDPARIDELLDRADQQSSTLEVLRVRAAGEVFGRPE